MICKKFLNVYTFMPHQCQCVLTQPSEQCLWDSTFQKVRNYVEKRLVSVSFCFSIEEEYEHAGLDRLGFCLEGRKVKQDAKN